MKNIHFVAGLHGNEYLPVLALASKQIPFTVGNPKALAEGVRFIEVDLNKSFGKNDGTYESDRAVTILDEISEETTVVDFHTSDTADTPFVIVTDLAMLPLARLTGIPHVVYMKHNIKEGYALINHRNGISIEVGKHKNSQSFQKTLEIVENLELNREHSLEVYEVYGKINAPGAYENFTLFQNADESFYPIFVGEQSYDFIGLRTRKLENYS